MDNSIVEILRYMRDSYGDDVFYNLSRARNLLSDLCPRLTQERIQANNFIELNGYFMLKYAGSAYSIVHDKLISTYISTYMVDESIARWIVDVFAVVLGLIPFEELTSPQRETKTVSMQEIISETRATNLISGYKQQAEAKPSHTLAAPAYELRTAEKPSLVTVTRGISNPNHSLIAADYHTVAVRRDGTVIATGYNNSGQCNVGHWRDIVSVAAGVSFTIGLRSDGTVIAAGKNDRGQCNVGRWRDIIAISAGARHTLGLRRDGVVLAVGENKYGECNVSGWRNIISIIAGNQCTYAIKKDRKVLSRGYNKDTEYDLSRLKDIVGVADANPHGALALKADGTVQKARQPMKGDFRGIRGLKAIAATPDCFIGLSRNGRVRILAYYWESSGVECSTDEWADITAITTGRYHVVGLRRDGTLRAAMLHTDATVNKGQCEVWMWSGLRV